MTKKKHGGHLTGARQDIAKGRGPVFEIRTALDILDKRAGGAGWSQERLAQAIGCSRRTVQTCESTGTLPQSPACQSLLHALAPPLSEREGKELLSLS
jgi:DNA-binding XRE family transcriptional regulator